MCEWHFNFLSAIFVQLLCRYTLRVLSQFNQPFRGAQRTISLSRARYPQGHGTDFFQKTAPRRTPEMAVARCRIYLEQESQTLRLRRVPFGLGAKEKTTRNSVWFLARMKCPTVKSSGEFSSAPTLHSSPPPLSSSLSPLFLLVVGRPSTLTIEALKKVHGPLAARKS